MKIKVGKSEERKFSPTPVLQLPKRPQHSSEAIRREMAERGRTDLYFLAKVILGYSAMTPRAHGALTRFLVQCRWKRRMVLMPRDHFKTSIATISYAIFRALSDPNIRILIISDTADNASLFLQEIRNHFESNQLLQWLYPDLIPDFRKVKWNDSELTLNRTATWREPTFMAIGSLGGVESRHFTLIIADDLVTEKHIRSQAEMDKLIHWLGGHEQLLTSDMLDEVLFVGSRKKKGDAYEHVQEYYGSKEHEPKSVGPYAERRGAMVIFSRGIIEEGKRIFPERVSWAYIIRMRTKEPERYHAQLANSPKGTGLNTFDIADLRFYTRKGSIIECWYEGKLLHRQSIWSMERIGLYDPAVSENKRNSKQAMGIICKGDHPFRFLIRSRVDHYDPSEAVKQLFEWDKRYQPLFWSIEKRAFQASIKYTIAEIANLKTLPMPVIQEWPLEGAANSQWAKGEHIKGLQPLVRENLLWIDPKNQEILDEVEFYPNLRWDDGLDMLSQSLDYWPMLGDEESASRKRESELDRLSLVTGRFDYAGALPQWDEGEFLRSLDSTGYSTRRYPN